MYEFELMFGYRDEAKKLVWNRVAVRARHPRSYYGKVLSPGGFSLLRDPYSVKLATFETTNTIAFMDATGLKPSNARVFGECGVQPPGFDHTRIWTAGRLHAVTTEPYYTDGKRWGDNATEWCAANGWQWHLFPPRIGMRNAGGRCGTRLILASPPKNGVDIAPMIAPMLKAMPRWERR